MVEQKDEASHTDPADANHAKITVQMSMGYTISISYGNPVKWPIKQYYMSGIRIQMLKFLMVFFIWCDKNHFSSSQVELLNDSKRSISIALKLLIFMYLPI